MSAARASAARRAWRLVRIHRLGGGRGQKESDSEADVTSAIEVGELYRYLQGDVIARQCQDWS